MIDVGSFFSFCVYMIQRVVSVLFDSLKISYNGTSFGLGDFFLAVAILSVVIGALVSSLRSASLGHEAAVANRKDAMRARSLGKGDTDG